MDLNYETNKLELLFFIIENDEVKDIVRKEIEIEKNKLKKREIKNIIKDIDNIDYSKEYKIKYLLKFTINYDIEKLVTIENNEKIYNLDIINNIQTIDYNNSKFNNVNSLIMIIEKCKEIKLKNNRTKKFKYL
jgi:hypothetical protein|tara:strand:+ start:37 stop:435 length:399 start_codon:yes stop_codon:yes gene_type:complete